MSLDELPNSDHSSSLRQRVEFFAAVILGLAGVAAAWSSYQAARWSGVQATEFTQAQALLMESTRESAAGDAERAIDVMTFSAWIEAYARGDERLMTFYRQRFRPEFATAFEVWLGSEPQTNPDAASTPFVMQQYDRARTAAAAELENRAQAAFERGRSANEVGDRHVLSVVLFATVLFMAGISPHSRLVGVQIGLLSVALMIFAFALYGMATLPNA